MTESEKGYEGHEGDVEASQCRLKNKQEQRDDDESVFCSFLLHH